MHEDTRLELQRWTIGGVILAALLLLCFASVHAATLLPNGKQQFINGNGVPLAGGTVYMYTPNTSSCKNTWQDSGQTTLNICPIQLDSNGMALIYGAGTYRQVVYGCATPPTNCDSATGILLYDQLTADTSASNAIFWAGTSSGTPNAITLVDASFSSTDGNIIYFRALNSNSGATTLTVSGIGPYAVVRDTAAGPVALIGGEIVTSNAVGVLFDSTLNQFHLIDSVQAASSSATAGIGAPQGYLNLVGASGGTVQTADVISATVVYYTPFTGNSIPIFNGSNFVPRTFTELTLTLTAGANSASTLYDACVFNNSGNAVLVSGPAWATSTAGSGARGTGAGTPELFQLNGLWVNKNAITGNNNGTSYSIPALQCTYVGSLSIDSSAGQVTAHRTYGQSRKFGVWNSYNKQNIYLKAGDPTASWSYGTNTIRSSNNNAANSLTVFTGLATEVFDLRFTQLSTQQVGTGSVTATSNSGIGWNSVAAFSGTIGVASGFNANASGVTLQETPTSSFIQVPSLGINTVSALERSPAANAGVTYFGTEANMALSAFWRG